MSASPAISIIMPTYNVETFVNEAIQSILKQTFDNFEFIIIDDGSIDRSLNIIKSFTDNRIKLIINGENLGHFPSFNKGYQIARGRYICIMGANDISLPQRLEQQYVFMEANPKIGITGSGYKFSHEHTDIYLESDYEILKVLLFRNNCFRHSTLFMRNSLLLKYQLQYDEKYIYSSDYDFIARASQFFPITNMPELLLHCQSREDRISPKYEIEQVISTNEIILNQLINLNIRANDKEKELHLKMINGEFIQYANKEVANKWMNTILQANKKTKYYKQEFLEDMLHAYWQYQPFFSNEIVTKTNKEYCSSDNSLIDLLDVTFVIPIRIESDYRKANLETLLKILNRDYTTRIIVLEADTKQSFYPNVKEIKNLEYYFIYDEDPVFHRTKYINKLLNLAKTPFVAVWDTDAIALPTLVEEAAIRLRESYAIMAFPYDGCFYSIDFQLSNFFRNKLDYDILISHTTGMALMNGYHAVGGAYLVNKAQYINAGGENENFYGWGPEDLERVKRMEILDLPVYRTKGSMFHLYHPISNNSCYANEEIQLKNRKELLKICAIKN